MNLYIVHIIREEDMECSGQKRTVFPIWQNAMIPSRHLYKTVISISDDRVAPCRTSSISTPPGEKTAVIFYLSICSKEVYKSAGRTFIPWAYINMSILWTHRSLRRRLSSILSLCE